MSNENINTDTTENEISLIDLFAVIAKRWRFIFFSTLIAAVFILAYSIYTKAVAPDAPFNKMPNIYCPKVVVRLQESSSSSSLGNLLSGSGENSILSGLLVGATGGNGNAALAQALLKGNTLIDQLAEEMNFLDKYNITEYPITSCRATAQGNMIVEFDTETSLLSIGYQDTDPVFATRVVNRTLELLETRFKELTMDSVMTKKLFYEDQLENQKKVLIAAQQKLIDFMRENGIVNIESQMEVQIGEIVSLNSELVSKEVQLRNLKKKRMPNDPEILQREEEIEILKQLLKGKTFGFSDFVSPTENIPQSQLPELAAEYSRLDNETKIQTQLYISFRTQFENAKLDEADNSKQFQIIERAEVPEVKFKPSRAKICVIFTLAIAFLSIFAVFIMEYFDKVKADPVESKKLEEIKKSLSLRK